MIKQYKPPIVLCGGLFSNLEFKDNVIIKLKKTYPSNEIIIPKLNNKIIKLDANGKVIKQEINSSSNPSSQLN